MNITVTAGGAVHEQRPLSRKALYELAEKGTINGAVFEAALRLTGIRPGRAEWSRYSFHLFSLCGALFFASGLICLIAWNWAQMHHFAKFALLEAAMAAGVGIAVWRGVRSVAGSAALLAAGACIGPLLAVFGQTYMSGAQYWELFRAWALLLLPFALLGKQAGLWFLFWLTGSVFVFGFTQDLAQVHDWAPGWGLVWGLPEFILLQLLAVASWEGLMRLCRDRPGMEWLRAVWLPRLALALTWTLLTALLFSLVAQLGAFHLHADEISLFLPFRPSLYVLYAAGLPCIYLWHRRVRPDLFVLGIGLFSLAALAMALILREKLFRHMDADSFLFWGISVALLTAGCGKRLLLWQRDMEAESRAGRAFREASGGAGRAERDFFGSGGTVADWPELWAALKERGLWPKDGAPPRLPPSQSAWYINTLLSLGGWTSAFFLALFLGFFLRETLGVGREYGIPLLVGGCVFLGIGMLCSRLPGMFGRQFGLACSLTGLAAACVAFVSLPVGERLWPLFSFALCACTFPLIRNRAYRFICAAFGLYFLYLATIVVLFGIIPNLGYGLWYDDASRAAQLWRNIFLWGVVFWGLASACIAWGWLRESRWMTNKAAAGSVPCLLHGLFAAMLFLLILSLLTSRVGFVAVYPYLLPPRAAVGLGAGFGFFLFAALLSRPFSFRRPERWLYTGGAALALPLGYYLPGAAVALFGFFIGRHSDNRGLFFVSALFLAAYLFEYYYNLETTLLYKSLSLMGCGLFLLFGALLVRRVFAERANILFDAAPQAPATPGGMRRIFFTRPGSMKGGTPMRAVLLVLSLVVAIGVFNLAARQKEPLLRGGTVMYLELAPVDPRAFLLGDYMELEFAIDREVTEAVVSRFEQGGPEMARQGGRRFLPRQGQAVVMLAESNVALFIRLDDGTPLGQDEHLLFFRLKDGRARVAAEAFFFQEGHARDYEKAAYGEIHVDEEGKSLLTHLLDQDLRRIVPARE